MASVLLRLIVALLAIAISAPAACIEPQPKRAADCCHKSCPKSVKVQPCFDCVADVRTVSVAPEQQAHAIVPQTVTIAVPPDLVTLRVTVRDPSTDRSDTYLRVGVLRL